MSANTSWNIINFRAGLVRALINDGHELVVLTPCDGFETHLPAFGCRHILLEIDSHSRSPWRDLKLFYRYTQVMRAERPDAFLGYTIKPNIYGSLAATWCSVPVINNISGLGSTFINDTLLTRVVQILYRAALRKSATVFFQNAEDRTHFVDSQLVTASQTELLPGSGIDLDKFAACPPLVEKPSTTFLMIARLLRDKGVFEFAEAARLVRTAHPDAHFQLLGPLDDSNPNAVSQTELQQWIDEDLIHYLGECKDVRPAIVNADCVVLPSYREGTPRSLLEAAAMAKPLIATDVPGCRNVVMQGINGYRCEARNAASLSKSIQGFLTASSNVRHRMGCESRRIAEERFDEKLVINAYRKALKRVPSRVAQNSASARSKAGGENFQRPKSDEEIQPR